MNLGRLLWLALVGIRRGLLGPGGGPFRRRVIEPLVFWTTIPPWGLP